VCRAAQRLLLTVDVVATTEHLDEDFFGVFGETEKLLADLLRQLTCWSDDEALDVTVFGVDLRQQRQAKGSRFTSAGLSLSDEVTTIFQKKGNGFLLDLSGLENTQFFQATDHVRRDSEINKGMRHALPFIRLRQIASRSRKKVTPRVRRCRPCGHRPRGPRRCESAGHC
jgi:hypothetical protein